MGQLTDDCKEELMHEGFEWSNTPEMDIICFQNVSSNHTVSPSSFRFVCVDFL
ncbi:hypothetical protein GUITHDRAFT_154570 [Guillardia theta CCMP2712]|uniref:Uncharacterized protein n=1 Tax=Guillardia theta (strain CCMP2712) TaxID=905079 RepID=L1ISJ0_GUITC|nr:hypothetical protein GUITHDRAFT_154570 [Guillardia theta CCMP2712]EKX38859.1 hypothetical protein GUITHDRAFT_154570 [Guillardia theta CCMP2712]|eukprot:XP_005825839.1 hypothetical protein GUITHDRAFT_154570 [Guillardia theta CCMP2712]